MAAQQFGLDIGRSFIKSVQVIGGKGNKVLTAAASVATPAMGINSDSKEDIKALAEAIKSCIKSARIEGNSCVVSLVESQAITRLIDLPNLTDKELTAAINFEADQYIPLPIKDVNLQYKVVNRPQSGSGAKMKVLLVAAPKRIINKYLEIIKLAGLKLAAIETESSALARVLSVGATSSLIVSMGATSTEFIVVKGGSVYFVRSISTGGNAITKVIEAEFKLSYSQAEEYKMAYGINEDKLSGKIAQIVKPTLEIIVDEILKAVEYTRGKFGGGKISRIITTGGGSYLPGLGEYLTNRTSIEVSLADPWMDFGKEGLIMKLPGQGSFYSVATGLAVRD